MNDVECPGKAARTRRRRLTGTGFTRLESRLWGLGLCGGGCIDPRGLSGTRHYYTMPNGKVKRPGTIFSVFFRLSVGRPLAVGLWPLAFGGRAAKKSPRHRQTFAGTPTAGGELRRGYRRLTTPPCVLKHHAPWRCGAHITYIMSSLCQANQNGNPGVSTVRCGQAFRSPDRPSTERTGRPFLAALRPCGVFYFTTNTWLYHRLLGTEKRFTRCQEYTNET